MPSSTGRQPPNGGVAALLARVVAPATADERAAEETTIAAMVAALHPTVDTDRRGSPTRRWVARTAIAAGVLIAGTGSAAATGALPDAAQSAIARATSHIGLVLPNPSATVHPTPTHPHTTPTTNTTTETSTPSTTATTTPVNIAVTTTPITVPTQTSAPTAAVAPETPAATLATGPRLDGPAKKGLCTAWDAHRRSGKPEPHGTAFTDLDAAAAAAGQSVADFCAPVLTTAPDTPTQPPSVDTPPAASARPAHGKPSTTSATSPETRPAATHPPHPTHPPKPTRPAKADENTP